MGGASPTDLVRPDEEQQRHVVVHDGAVVRYESRYRRYRTANQRWNGKNPPEAHAMAHEADPRAVGEKGGACKVV